MRSTIVTILLLAAGCENASKLDPSVAPPVARTVDKPAKLDFYVMSKCPYGVQVEKAVAPVLAQLGGNVDLHISYIGDAQGDQLSSMHGPTEVAGDIAQLCARDVAPDRYFKMIQCQDSDPAHVDTNWESCGASAGIDTSAMKACIAGKGKQLLAASFADAKQRGASASPTIYLNGQPYKGARKTKDLLRAVCTSFDGTKPEACASLPAPVAVNATFFSDVRCKDCNIDALEGRLRQMFDGLTVKKVDYMTPEGKALYADLGLKTLPVILFDRTLDADKDGKQQIARYLKPAGTYQALALGGHFDPTAEICDNQLDDDGNGKSDCDDATCTEALACRPEVKKSLDLFVMSHCPFGTKAMLAAKEFSDAFGKDATVAVHFIGDNDNGKLTSMHGPDEVTDDLREVCAIEHYGKDQKFLDFLACRSKDLTADWKACTGANGIDAGVIESCVASEGPSLLTASFAVAEKLDFHASPTYLVNNRATIDARDAAGIQAGFCTANPGLPGCAKRLTATAPAQQTKGAAACK